MHDALLISEVLTCIFDHLAEDTVRHPEAFYARDTRKTGRRALAVLARTCRAFSEPALDALWRRLHSLAPFILCLPTSATYDDGAMLPFNEEEWNTVSRYALRVQELRLENEPLSMEILQSLWFRTTLLLPNLRKLHWIYDDYTTIGSIRLLLAPSLVHLHVWLDAGDHSSVLGLLECYHTLCPNLKSLHFGHLRQCPHVTAAVSRAISRSKNLETLACDSLDEAALIHIAESRCLKRLTADLLRCQPEYLRRLASYGTPDHPPFKNLCVLSVCVEDLSSFIPCLRAHHQPFEEVSLEFDVPPAAEALHEFLTALSSARRQATLRRIRLRSICRTRISSRPVDFQILSPLMAFNLQSFEIELCDWVSLGDDELAQLVQSWPQLETFYFNHGSGRKYPPSIKILTLRGLLLLLVRCPKLRKLRTCVDARNIPALTEDESSIRNTAITTLCFTNSLIQEPVAGVVQFLLEHFPSLVALHARVPFDGQAAQDCGHLWREVGKQIREVNGPDWSRDSSDSDSDSDTMSL